MRPRSIHLVAVIAVLASLFLGACGTSGDSNDEGASTTATTATTGGGDKDGTTTSGASTTSAPADADPVEVSADAKPYVDAMVKGMQSDKSTPLTDKQAECFASRFVDDVGVDALKSAGVDPASLASTDTSMDFKALNLTKAEGNAIYDNFGKCGINLREEMMKSMATDGELSVAAKACFETALTDDNLRKIMVTSMIKGDAALENDPELSAVMGALMGCAFMGMGSSSSTTTTAAG